MACLLAAKKYNDNGKILRVGDISDIIDIVDAKHIRWYLLKQYSGYLSGIISERRRSCKGTVSYKKFKENVEECVGILNLKVLKSYGKGLLLLV